MTPRGPSDTELVNRLVAVTSERDQLLDLLRGLGNAEGDRSLVNQVCIWRSKADTSGQRQVLAERALRALQPHWSAARAEVDAWLDGTNRTYQRSSR